MRWSFANNANNVLLYTLLLLLLFSGNKKESISTKIYANIANLYHTFVLYCYI